MAPTKDHEIAANPSRRPPVILIVASDDRERAAVLGHLRRRYREDYDVHAEGLPASAVKRLNRLRDDGVDLAIMLVDCQLSDRKAIELLHQTQTSHPRAIRALLVSRSGAYGAQAALAHEYARAAILGEVQRIVTGPGGQTDEQFNLAIQELVYTWARQNRPRFEVIRIVGDRWSPASHKFRDHLERGAISYGFYEPDSPEGRTLLQHAGTTGPLPIAILHDGRVFVQPTATDIVEALGMNPAETMPSTVDVAVIGAGPAGLAAAVYAASEGLSVVVIEAEVFRGPSRNDFPDPELPWLPGWTQWVRSGPTCL